MWSTSDANGVKDQVRVAGVTEMDKRLGQGYLQICSQKSARQQKAALGWQAKNNRILSKCQQRMERKTKRGNGKWEMASAIMEKRTAGLPALPKGCCRAKGLLTFSIAYFRRAP